MTGMGYHMFNLMMLHFLASIWLTLGQVDIDYYCPNNCLCATLDMQTLDKVQLRCEIPTVSGINFEIIQSRYTTNLYLVCNPLTGAAGQLADGAFEHLVGLEELSFEHCNLGDVTARTFRGLAALKTLNITQSVAARFHADALVNTPYLEVVNFHQQQLQRLPNGLFCGLNKLRHLDLSENRLGSEHDLGITNENTTCMFPELDWLNIMYNEISGPLSLVLSHIAPSLHVFIAHINRISELSENTFQNLTELKYLDISGSHIKSIRPNSMRGLPSLEIMYISGNRIQCLSKDIFQDTPKLRLFVAKFNHLNQTCMDHDLFQHVTSLQYVDLHRNHLTEIKSSWFQNLTELKELFLGHNQIDVITAGSFQNLHELLMLNLTHNKLEQFVVYTSERADIFPVLHTLDLSHNKLRDGGLNLGELPSLQTLFLNDNNLQTFPSHFNTSLVPMGIDISNNNISTVRASEFQGYDTVNTLILRGNRIKYIPARCFQHMQALGGLDLSHNAINTLEFHAFSLPPYLTQIDLSYNHIHDINLVFDQMPSLELLLLTKNDLTTITKDVFPESIIEIDLSYNKIHFIESGTFNDKPRLHSVRLNGNRFQTIQPNVFHVSPLVPEKPKFYIGINPYACDCTMEYIRTHNNGPNPGTSEYIHGEIADINRIFCWRSDRFGYQHVAYRDVKQFLCTFDYICADHSASCMDCCHAESIAECKCRQICPDSCTCYRTFDSSHIEIDCASRNLTSIPAITFHSNSQYYLYDNDIETISRGLFKDKPSITHLYLNNTNIETIEARSFKELTKLQVLDLNDNHLHDLSTEAFTGLKNLSHLRLRGNNLTQFTHSILYDLPKLQFLDLRDNSLETIDTDIFGSGDNITSIDTLYLSNNVWSCDCSFGPKFQNWLTANFLIIKDTEYIKCSTWAKEVVLNYTSSVLAADFSGCKPARSEIVFKMSKTLAILIIIMAILFIIILSLTIIIFVKRELLQVWLYSRFGLRIFKSKEDDDRYFDAFISYSQRDQAVVVQELLPRLEEGNPPYTLCVHFRDWLIGRGIAESVVQSVNASKRTILLLSNAFIESEWCNYEFKTAHHRLLQDKSCHLIVILLDDEPPKVLDYELQLYIKTHTYIRYSDPWFWERLKYALPDVTEEQKLERYEHKRKEKEQIEEQKRFLENRGGGRRGRKMRMVERDVEMKEIC